MKTKFISLAIMLFPIYLYAQEQWFFYDKPNEAFEGFDIETDTEGNLLVLGGQWPFFPPYPDGVPIEGFPFYGNNFIVLNSDLMLIQEEIFYNYRRQGPSGTYMKLDDADNVFVPIVALRFPFNCTPAAQPLDYRKGLIKLMKKDTGYISELKIIKENDFCEVPAIQGFLSEKDSLLFIHAPSSNDFVNYTPYNYTFQWFSKDLNTLSITKQDYSSFFRLDEQPYFGQGSKYIINKFGPDRLLMSGNNYLNGGLLELGIFDNKGNFQSSIHTFPEYGERAQFLDVNSQNEIVLIQRHYNNGVRSFYITIYDEQLNEITRNHVPYEYFIDAALLPNDEIVATMRNDNYQYYVGHFDPNGKMLAVKHYTDRPYIFGNITAVGDTAFAVVGTKWIPYNESDYGNPYAQLFVMKDNLANLTPVATTDIQEDSKILVYPNPATANWFIRSEEGGEAVLYDLNGKELQSVSIRAGKAVSISAATYPAGMYFLKFFNTTDNSIEAVILVKQ